MSSGEEAYSLAIVALEQIAAGHLRLELQIFATDVDEDALQLGRAGVYPESIQADVTPDRLKQFFVRENAHFRVAQELRKAVIFSRHDVLHDPPFSRLDLVSCRNVLIYLLPEAQRQLLTRLHFALRVAGVFSWARRNYLAQHTPCSSRSTRNSGSIGAPAAVD